MKIAAVQHDIAWEDPATTRASLVEPLARAADTGATLALVTEMFATGFSMAAERISEPLDGPTTVWMHEQAHRSGMWVGGSIPTSRSGGRPQNVFTLVAPDGRVHRYAKLHPFSYAQEDQLYDAGDERMTLTIDGVRVTPFVCYDLRFANAFWDMASDTDCYVVVANWPEARREHWMALLRARAIENQAYVVGVNRIGDGGGLTYSGDSRIIDPLGVELATAHGIEAVLVAEIDPEHVASVRSRFPFLNDRRTL